MLIKKIYAHIYSMKTRLNLTVDKPLSSDIKVYATKQKKSVSELVEVHFKNITKPARRKNIIRLVEKLETPAIDKTADLKELFYKDQAKKYGF
jgi:hypothetical protein